MANIVRLVPLFPLLGFIINGLFNKKLPEKVVGWIGSGSVFISFLLSVWGFFLLTSLSPEARSIQSTWFTWIVSGSFTSSISFLYDPLSAVMMLVVTGVGCLIHVYSMGYMHGDGGVSRYFAFLNLFTFSMLCLVMANNFILLYLGWEGVGLCSYLLIGFWFDKKSAADAGKKAFIVNRIGDFGFALGIMLLYWTLQKAGHPTVNLSEIIHIAPAILAGTGIVTVITLLFFLGATGKSAQIPLYVWLPDAMEGPTPVSALIHAATMVTAGVYMVSRLSALYVLSPVSMMVVAIIGVSTALFAATIATVQNDIKRVLAYSTISQLGYMFLACGVGAFASGIFHLMTHAFFKALLFMGAGSVMHALAGELDMRKMGALRKYLPVTFITMLVGTLAISGVPFFSGFFSKDEILFQAFTSPHGSPILWGVGMLTAVLTAFYMFRLMFLTFYGSSRMESETERHVHESPRVMTVPLIILAVLSFVGGYVGLPKSLGGGNWFEKFLSPVFPHENTPIMTSEHPLHSLEYVLLFSSIVAAGAGIWVAYRYYITKPERPKQLALRFNGLYNLLVHKYYVDEFYNMVIVQPLISLALFFWKITDIRLIDGLANGIASSLGWFSSKFRFVQTGLVRNYALFFVIGVILLMGFIILR
ncbi:MAG TPA: NADH-quinone oxidoreductase subunit L [candidate division Zixibacteria bacterium]|nr:NADH-quinone oxidoreductase subunit L [candidate division Zixibacteria bacterium]